jgi:hypothetical protein
VKLRSVQQLAGIEHEVRDGDGSLKDEISWVGLYGGPNDLGPPEYCGNTFLSNNDCRHRMGGQFYTPTVGSVAADGNVNDLDVIGVIGTVNSIGMG